MHAWRIDGRARRRQAAQRSNSGNIACCMPPRPARARFDRPAAARAQQLAAALTGRDDVAVCEDEASRLVHHKASGVAGPRALRVKRPAAGDAGGHAGAAAGGGHARRTRASRQAPSERRPCMDIAARMSRADRTHRVCVTFRTTTAGTTESSACFQASLATCGDEERLSSTDARGPAAHRHRSPRLPPAPPGCRHSCRWPSALCAPLPRHPRPGPAAPRAPGSPIFRRPPAGRLPRLPRHQPWRQGDPGSAWQLRQARSTAQFMGKRACCACFRAAVARTTLLRSAQLAPIVITSSLALSWHRSCNRPQPAPPALASSLAAARFATPQPHPAGHQ